MTTDEGRQIVVHATMIGQILEANHPAVDRMIPAEAVDEVANTITLVVAQILQAWLDAGSERDVTLEELGPAIYDHVEGWAA